VKIILGLGKCEFTYLNLFHEDRIVNPARRDFGHFPLCLPENIAGLKIQKVYED
jgi:hypothetical protein